MVVTLESQTELKRQTSNGQTSNGSEGSGNLHIGPRPSLATLSEGSGGGVVSRVASFVGNVTGTGRTAGGAPEAKPRRPSIASNASLEQLYTSRDTNEEDINLGDRTSSGLEYAGRESTINDGRARARQSVMLPAHQRRGLRGVLARLLEHQHFDLVMGSIIICNIGVMIVETDHMSPCAEMKDKAPCSSDVLSGMDKGFLVIYTIEASIRLFVLRLRSFRSMWNILDFAIVVFGYFDLILSTVDTSGLPGPSLSLLRIFRVFRLMRAIRVFQKIPELYAMLRGFLSAMQSMFWGFVMIIILLVLFSVLCVELIHPFSLTIHEGDDYCRAAFGSVGACVIMFFQTLVAGDSWGRCTIPIVKEQQWTFVIFSAALISVQLGFMNLILAVIVERAKQNQEEDDEEQRKAKLKQAKKATLRLNNLFAQIDEDDSGTISLDELLEGFDSNAEMQNMFGKLDMTRSDVQLLFELMDGDDEGELSYDFLIENIRTCQLDDQRKNVSMLRLQVAEIGRSVKKIAHSAKSEPGSPDAQAARRMREISSQDDTEPNKVDDSPPNSPPTVTFSPSATPRVLSPRGRRGSVSPSINFEQEVQALRDLLDTEFAGMRKNMDKLNNSVCASLRESAVNANPFPPSSEVPGSKETTYVSTTYVSTSISTSKSADSKAPDGTREEKARQTSSQAPSQKEVPFKDEMLDARQAEDREDAKKSNGLSSWTPRELPEGPQQKQLAAMLDDTTLRVEKGPAPGEVSL